MVGPEEASARCWCQCFHSQRACRGPGAQATAHSCSLPLTKRAPNAKVDWTAALFLATRPVDMPSLTLTVEGPRCGVCTLPWVPSATLHPPQLPPSLAQPPPSPALSMPVEQHQAPLSPFRQLWVAWDQHATGLGSQPGPCSPGRSRAGSEVSRNWQGSRVIGVKAEDTGPSVSVDIGPCPRHHQGYSTSTGHPLPSSPLSLLQGIHRDTGLQGGALQRPTVAPHSQLFTPFSKWLS